MSETRKLAAILVADIVGYSRLAGADEDRILARLRTLRSDLIDPTVAVHHGRVVKRTGDGSIIEFRSVVDAVRCALEIQNAMIERNAGVPEDRRIVFRVGIHIGDVVEESDGDLMGDGINIAARLEGIAEPGGICLSASAHEHVQGRIEAGFVDLGDKELKNIARPVRVYAINPNRAASVIDLPASTKIARPRLSIVVLPFANLGGDSAQEYFVDGVTESLTTDLSCISRAFVIARNTAFTYKGKAVDVKQIGKELNVRYVLEGSVQRGGSRMRVNVQLIDAESGSHLWADRFDKPVADLFDMQDEIVARLARALDSQLVFAEARRAEQAQSPVSIDLYFQGRGWLHKGAALEHITRAREFFERALAADAGNVDALVGIGAIDTMVGGNLMCDDWAARLAAAEATLTEALSLKPDHAQAHLHLGNVYGFTNRAEQGIAECERALALNRNLAAGHSTIGWIKFVIGRGEETEGHVREALRLSPFDASAYMWMACVGFSKTLVGDDEEAVIWLRRSIEANRTYALCHFALAAALAHLGQQEEARASVQAGRALDATFTIARFRAGVPNKNPIFLAQRERACEGMRKAGVPEG
ncbi:MAG TPA: adenylate/guanylate cyclase domain-containing protein [Roseiarcus sp.]|nr:adenylate/guanylate cyclase domain-containing protein [Roseiarcus sp.]